MTVKFADRVRETTTTQGTGSIALGGAAASNVRAFADAFADGDEVGYCIETATAWEVGVGTFTAPSTLARTTVESSSNADALVSFPAGTKSVYATLTAGQIERLGATVATLSALAALSEDDFAAGATVAVASLSCPFVLDKSNTLDDDGIKVVGNWVRASAPSTRWQSQANWYLNWDAGNDEADGSVGAPIKSFAEWSRRTGGISRVQIMTLHIVSAVHPEKVTLNISIEPDNPSAVYLNKIEVRGPTPSVVMGGAMSSVQNWSAATPTDGRFTDSALPVSWTASLGSFVGTYVHFLTGALATAFPSYAIPIADKGGRVLQLGHATDETGFRNSVPMADGDTYEVIRLGVQMSGHFDIDVSGSGYLRFLDLILGNASDGSHQIQCRSGQVQFDRCYVYGADVQKTNGAFDACWIHGLRQYEGFDPIGVWGCVLVSSHIAYGGKCAFVNSIATCTINAGTSNEGGAPAVLKAQGAMGLACVDVGVGVYLSVGGWLEAIGGRRVWGFNVANSLVSSENGTSFVYDASAPPTVTGAVSAGALRIGGVAKTIAEVTGASGGAYTHPTNRAHVGPVL